MRRIAVLILCLLLPLQGFAALHVVDAPCPMQEMMAMNSVDGDGAETLPEAMNDCCNDPATFEHTGQPCKSVQSCTAPAAWILPFRPVVFMARATQDLWAPLWRSLTPGATARLWRPPTSV